MKVGIALSTKDRVELTRQAIQPLLQPDLFDLHIIDGSATNEGRELAMRYPAAKAVRLGVRGGADAAIMAALSHLLAHPAGYTHVGLVENDVVLHPDWFGPTMALFERGAAEGLEVGAVSARCYEDRILIQRDGYALMHNLGAGMIVLTRAAAQIVLNTFRTTFTSENRRAFAVLSGLDIGVWWAFRTSEHWLCADWGIDRCLASAGLASLALTPSQVEMIGQVPPLAEQGLTLVTRPVELLRHPLAFGRFAHKTRQIRAGEMVLEPTPLHRDAFGVTVVFAHQLRYLIPILWNWHLQWVQGFGPFAYRSEGGASVEFEAVGPVDILVGNSSEEVVTAEVTDASSGFAMQPRLAPAKDVVVSLSVPGAMTSRMIKVSLGTGGLFYGVRAREPQPWFPRDFSHGDLPVV